MSCRDTIHLICWYLEGKLSPSVSKDIEQHLGSCANCRVVLSAATTTLDQYFATLAELEHVVTERCRVLNHDQLKPGTNFHWWPKPATPS